MLKKTFVLIALCGATIFLLSGPAAARDGKPFVLKLAKGKLTDVFKRMDTEISSTAAKLSTIDFASPGAREILRACSSRFYSVDCVIFDARGVMKVVEPAEQKKFEGTNLGADPILVQVRESKKPILSNVFRAAEGMDAVTVHYPILSSDKKFLGSIGVLIKPEILIAKVIGPTVEATAYSCTVLQKDGRILYDSEAREIGRNIITDPIFNDLPELRDAMKKVVKEKNGSASYRLMKKGDRDAVRKEMVWGTAELDGTEWRITIVGESADNPAPKAK